MSRRSRIWLVEDDAGVRDALLALLVPEGYLVETFRDAAGFARRAAEGGEPPDLVLMDWALPDGTGVDLLRDARRGGQRWPCLFITARHETFDKVLALELGANDYLTKPFDPRELLARIRVQLRGSPPETDELRSGEIRVSLRARQVHVAGQEVRLTRMEFELLVEFIKNPARVYSREELLNRVWGYDRMPTTRTVDTHVLRLRQVCGAERFETVHGIGYRFKPGENLHRIDKVGSAR